MRILSDSPVRPMLRRAAEAVVLGSALLAAWGPAHGQDLLEPEQAFRVEARMTGPQTLAVTWRIADGHYMYRQAFSLSAPRGGVILGEPSFPEGNNRHDEFFGDVVTFEDDVTFTVPVTPIANGLSRFDLRATGQGCNEPLGVCYPPLTRDLVVDMDTAGGAPAQSMMSEVPGAAAAGDATQALFGGGSNQAGFLHPDEAFRFELSPMGGDALLVRFSIEPGYYLYKDRFSVSSGDPDVRVESIQLPEGRSKTDEYFGDTVVYYDGFDAQASLQRDSGEARTASFNVGFQGCADGGICYPPSEKTVSVRLPAAGEDAAAPGALSQGQGDARSGAWALVLAFGAGLLLTFTPCVLPMVPILAGIIIGQGDGVTRRRGGGLAAVYVLGTAVTYTAAGVVAGLTGEQLQAWFQNIWAVGLLAVLMLLMALSMFGLYELRMPSAVQTRLQHRASDLKAGAVGGVFVMGMLSALIVGACVSPVLISVLGIAISRGDPVLGGAIMFAMALGMGMFLIAMGFGFGHLLPRAGPWMERVRHTFGIMLLAVAVYLLGAVPEVPVLYLWAALLLGTAVYLGVQVAGDSAFPWKLVRQLAAAALVAWAAMAVLGGLQGNRDILRPVDFQSLAGTPEGQEDPHARFRRVADRDELARLMEQARSRGRPVMVDYYADWCVDCVRMERTTFADPEVAGRLNREFTLIQVDVTDPDDPGTRAIKRGHGVFGPPAMLFFDRRGREIRGMRRYGYMDRETFLDHIQPLASG